MKPSKIELAVLNNVHWYEALFSAHGISFETDQWVWVSHGKPPPFHSNLVVLSRNATQGQIEPYLHQIASTPRPGGWSMKDSYACLDLVPLGFSELFEANWIWMEPSGLGPHDPTSNLVWQRITNVGDLSRWEAAWAGDGKSLSAASRPCQFPGQLLADPHFVFLAGSAQGEIVAGGILNQSPGAVGVSNVFAQPIAGAEVWPALVRRAVKEYPNRPLVGYERDAGLQAAQQVGFTPVGALRVWSYGA
jgi:hypothetical protein